MEKLSSLLDYTYPGLNPLIWLQDGTLNPVHKDFVLKLLNSFYTNYNLKNSEQWVVDITIIGSLTTNKYLLNKSDFDCHVIVDIDKFIETNMPNASKEEAITYLDNARKTWDRAKILMPFTIGIILELYFESDLNPSNVEHVGRYSMLQNKWLKSPIYFEQDEDFEFSRKEAIEGAKELANELDDSFGEIGRQIQRIDELKEVLQAWPEEKRQLYYDKVQKKLDIIEEELEKSIQIKQDLVDQRHLKQDAFSDNEIQFKFLARFQYFSILQNLKTLLEQTGGQVTTQELPLIEKIISQGAVQLPPEDAPGQSDGWIDPDGRFYSVSDSDHSGFSNIYFGENQNYLLAKSWVRVANYNNEMMIETWSMPSDAQWGIIEQIFFIGSIDKMVLDFKGYDVPTFTFKTFMKSGESFRDYVTSLLSPTRKIKQASNLSHAYWVDPNGKIYTVRPNKSKDLYTHSDWISDNWELLEAQYGINSIGDYEQMTEKMYTDGWSRIGDSGQSDMGYGITVGSLSHIPKGIDIALAQFYKGEELIVEGYFEHESVFIDDPFPNLQNAVNKALSRKRTGSLKEAAHIIKMWLDPSGKEYLLPESLHHGDWIKQNRDLLHKYGIEFKGIDTWDEMLQKGWTRILTYPSGTLGIEVADRENIPSYLDDFIAKYYSPGQRIQLADEGDSRKIDINDPFPSLEKALNKENRNPIWGSLKEAFLKEAFEKETDTLLIDFDSTLAEEHKDGSIGEPLPNAKESLDKLKNLGYDIEIYSVRANDEKGLDDIKEWLDKYTIPYDSIFQGEKPKGLIIDDHAIEFKSWEDTLQEISS